MVLAALKVESRPKKMTYEEFLVWADEDTLAEWVSGEVIMTSPASLRHQEISVFLGTVLRAFVEAHDLGKVIVAPFQMKVGESGREPDLIFVAETHRERLKETYLDGPADLAVEIISPESGDRDRGEKFYEYEAVGIPEYWLIDPQREQAEFYQLDEKGHYQLIRPDEEGVYISKILTGLSLPLAWLWQPPKTLDALKYLQLI
ncbi:MAG: Uma2 family endonuclease [Chloroflexi bacterium]|nr:Uma2 family endonuclease [Chloroflexota bacterium]